MTFEGVIFDFCLTVLVASLDISRWRCLRRGYAYATHLHRISTLKSYFRYGDKYLYLTKKLLHH
ncbi:hypothetical protein F8S20_17670 [Nostoc sp. BAE]|nr:hypothetical protein [Nostoc commune BAE]